LCRRIQAGWKTDRHQHATAVLLQHIYDHPSRGQGLYLHGSVGSGKTALMDLLVDSCRLHGSIRVTRLHFHELMKTAHSEMYCRHRAPAEIGADVGSQADIVALDEMQITDIADAAIVSRLIEGLCNVGATLVCTSNRAPSELYENGLNRHVYIPQLVSTLEAHGVTAHQLVSEGHADYRRHAPRAPSRDRGGTFSPAAASERRFHASSENANATLLAAIGASSARLEPASIRLGPTRMLRVCHASHGAAIVKFDQLCGSDDPLGANDYLALTQNLHTLALTGVPSLTPAMHNEGAMNDVERSSTLTPHGS